MNISKQTIEALNEMFSFTFYDNFTNEVEVSKATEIFIGFTKEGEYIGKTIKAIKKEITIEYVMDKLNVDKTFKSFSNYFNSIISKFGLSAYATTYGIGVFVAVGHRNSITETKAKVEKTLAEMGIKFTTEYSEAGWVFRYKISKTSENINLIQTIIRNTNIHIL